MEASRQFSDETIPINRLADYVYPESKERPMGREFYRVIRTYLCLPEMVQEWLIERFVRA